MSEIALNQLYFVIGLGIVAIIVTAGFLYVKWENRRATKYHERDFEQFKQKYSQRTIEKSPKKVVEHYSA